MNAIPESIGRYKIERLIGQGAMGSVYLGRDPELDRAVAVKTVKKLDLEEERLEIFLSRFKNEARAAARLQHPAIVAVYDVGEDPAVGPYMVCEYVPGSTLKQIVRGRGRLDPDAVVKLGRQIAAAIDVAHVAEVIHRDIKPDNILVSAAGDAKLADFGVARVPDAALTKEGQFLGTPCYAAPETLEKGLYGPHSDLFSFAAVLYEAITAVRAFPGDDAISVAHHVVHDHPVDVAKVAPDVGLPSDVAKVVMRGLSKDPADRYETAMALVDALARAYVETGVLDRDPTGVQVLPGPEIHPPAQAGGGGFGFALVLALLAIVGVGMAWFFLDLGDDGGTGVVPDRTVDAGEPQDAGVNAAAASDAGRPDGGDAGRPDGGDAGSLDDAGPELSALPSIESMSAFDRDEAAKDAVDDAEAAIAAGDLDAARAALRLARHYDPGNSDLDELAEQIEAATDE